MNFNAKHINLKFNAAFSARPHLKILGVRTDIFIAVEFGPHTQEQRKSVLVGERALSGPVSLSSAHTGKFNARNVIMLLVSSNNAASIPNVDL